jgi:hypothetical protein
VHFKKIFVRDGLAELSEKTGRKGASDDEVAGLESEARARYASKTNCKPSAFKRWELIMSAHPEVLRMCDAREPGINLSAVKDIVESTAHEAQPEAARRVSEIAKAKKGDVEAPSQPDERPVVAEQQQIAETIPAPAMPAKSGRRSEAKDRARALGIARVKSRSVEELRNLAAALDRSGSDDPMVNLAALVLRYAANDESVNGDPVLDEVLEIARKNGGKA